MDGRELRRSEFMFVDRPWLGCQTLVRRRHTVGSSSGSGVRVLARRPLPALAGPSAHELRVALGTRYYDIHPDPHGLRGRGHHVVQAVVGFHTEGQRWVRTLGDHGDRRGDVLDQRLHLLHLRPLRHSDRTTGDELLSLHQQDV